MITLAYARAHAPTEWGTLDEIERITDLVAVIPATVPHGLARGDLLRATGTHLSGDRWRRLDRQRLWCFDGTAWREAPRTSGVTATWGETGTAEQMLGACKGVERVRLVRAVAALARDVLGAIPAGALRDATVALLDVTERWCDGTATSENVAAARVAAWAVRDAVTDGAPVTAWFSAWFSACGASDTARQWHASGGARVAARSAADDPDAPARHRAIVAEHIPLPVAACAVLGITLPRT